MSPRRSTPAKRYSTFSFARVGAAIVGDDAGITSGLSANCTRRAVVPTSADPKVPVDVGVDRLCLNTPLRGSSTTASSASLLAFAKEVPTSADLKVSVGNDAGVEV